MSLYRCAVCGSSNVTPETKQEGYDKKKGIMGMALFGLGGAVAGTSGNSVVYYHCAACGHTLNKCMHDSEKTYIDTCLANYMVEPDNHKNNIGLKMLKKQYPNIEWEESINESKDNTEEQQSRIAQRLQQAEVAKVEGSKQYLSKESSFANAFIDALYKVGRPCTISEIKQNIESPYDEYSIEDLSTVARKLCTVNIVERFSEKAKAYFRAIPNSKEEAIMMLQKK